MAKKVLHNLPRGGSWIVNRETETKKIIEKLSKKSRYWLIAICGMGGVGKSTLALRIARLVQFEGDFDAIVWTSSKSRVLTKKGVEEIDNELLVDLDDLLNTIGNVLRVPIQEIHANEKHNVIQDALTKKRTLVIVDNLETINETNAAQILWFLRDLLPAPSKAIITSRYRLAGEGEAMVELEGLSFQDSLQLMKTEKRLEEFFLLNRIDEKVAREIFDKAGGNPLAIKWLLGQINLRNKPSKVLEKLEGSKNEPLLDYCFQFSFQNLKPSSKELLQWMSALDSPANPEYLKDLCKLQNEQFQSSIAELTSVFLIDEEKRQLTMLPLTKLFARKQLAKDASFEHHVLSRLEDFKR